MAVCLMSCAPMPAEDGVPGSAGAMGPAGRDGRDAVVAGSRLRPLWLIGTDGSRVPSFAFWDNERRERCFLQAVPGNPPDSMERICAPWGIPADVGRFVRFSLEQ